MVVNFGKPLYPEDFLENEDEEHVVTTKDGEEYAHTAHSDEGDSSTPTHGARNEHSSSGVGNREALQRYTDGIRNAIVELKAETNDYLESGQPYTSDRAEGMMNVLSINKLRAASKHALQWSVPIFAFHLVTVLLRTMETMSIMLLKNLSITRKRAT